MKIDADKLIETLKKMVRPDNVWGLIPIRDVIATIKDMAKE